MSKEFPELRRGESEQLIDQAIADVLPSEDPFESPNFDVIAMLNKHFPNELSLTSIETTCDRLAVKMNELDISILHAVELQSSEGEAAKQDLERANRSVSELMANLKSIKERGEATKSMVHEICRDIQTLDFAKQNLTTTIIALRRLNMLENAIEQLSEMTAARAYKEAANLLEAMTQLAANFDAFKNVPKVCELLASVRALRSQLQAQVLEEFKLHINVTMPEDVSCMLKDAAQVVCVLGQGLILKLVKWFSDKELGEYENLFDPSKHPAGLESVEKRFAWLRRWLRSFSFSYGEVMPSSWEVPRVVSEEFCHRTRNHLAQLLQKKSKEMDVRLLMHVIQKTIEFEQELSGRFFVAGVEAEAEGKAGEGEGASNEGRMKFAVNCGSENRRSAFDRIISRVFKPYMSLFLKLERAHMADLVKSLLSKEDWGAGLDNETEEEEAPVLSSTGELFLYIKRSLNQCSAVDTGETLLHLSRAFEETLIQYAQGLHKHIAEKARSKKNLPAQDERVMAIVINTLEYSSDIMEQLQTTISKAIDPSLAQHVSFAGLSDSFDNAIAEAQSALVNSFIAKTDNALTAIAKIRWADMESVGDQSSYVNSVQQVIKETFPDLRGFMSSSYFSSLCDKCASLFFPRLLSNYLKIRRVSDAAVQQLLLDVTALKSVVLSMPTVEHESGRNFSPFRSVGQEKIKTTASFTRLVNAEAAKVENVLKVLLSPADQMEQNYAALVKGRDKQQLQRMLEMKGIKSQSSSLQVFDVVEETRAAGQALTESMREKLDQSSLKANLDSMAGKVVGHVSSTMVKTFT